MITGSLPTVFLRSALFSITESNAIRFTDESGPVQVHTLAPWVLQISSGGGLTTNDSSLMAKICHKLELLLKFNEAADVHCFEASASELARAAFGSDGGSQVALAKAGMTKLAATTAELYRVDKNTGSKVRRAAGSLISFEDLPDNRYRIFLHPGLRAFISKDGGASTMLDDRFDKLGGGAGMARIIGCWILSHDEDRQVGIDFLQKISRSTCTRRPNLRVQVKKAMAKLVEAGIVAPGWTLKNDWLGFESIRIARDLQLSVVNADASTTTAPMEPAPSPALPKNVTPNDIKFAQYMLDELRTSFPKLAQPSIAGWSKDVSLMRRLDHRSLNDAWTVLKWAIKDPFWCRNILSPATLRKQYDRLVIAMNTPAKQSGSGYRSQADINKAGNGVVV